MATQAFPTANGKDHFTIVPNNTVNFVDDVTNNPNGYKFAAIYVGVSGDISVVSLRGVTKVYKNVPVGFMPIAAIRVNATGTNATDLLGVVE